MTEEQLANAARLMAESQDRLAASYDRFVEAVLRHTEMMTTSINRLSVHENFLELHMKSYDARLDFLGKIQDSLSALLPALSDAVLSADENNERTEKLTRLLELHLGSTDGLRFDN